MDLMVESIQHRNLKYIIDKKIYIEIEIKFFNSDFNN